MSRQTTLVANITIAIVGIIIVAFLLFVYVFRFSLFGVKLTQDSESDAWLALGYGYYDAPVYSNCETVTGLCTQPGFQEITRQCVKNPTTGAGCIDSDGNQTFVTQISRVSCIPQCRKTIFVESESGPTGVCIPKSGVDSSGALLDTCIEPGTLGTYLRTLTCVAHDPSGINGCVSAIPPFYIMEPPGPPTPPPAGFQYIDPRCTIDASGTLATCTAGAVIEQPIDCIPDQTVYPPCGIYAVEDDPPTKTVVCDSSFELIPSKQCYNLDSTGAPTLLSGVGYIYTVGFTLKDAVCVDTLGDLPTPGQLVRCKNPPECEPTVGDVRSEYLSSSPGNSVFLCMAAPTPNVDCTKPCIYYNPEDFTTPAFFADWIPLIKTPVVVSIGPQQLSLLKIPCPGVGGRYLANGVIPSDERLSDCFGDPNAPLEATPMIFYNPSTIAADAVEYGLSSICSTTEVADTSSTIYLFKPIVVLDSGATFYCRIIAIHGKSYIGRLTVPGAGQNLTWNQLQSSDLIVHLPDFIVTKTGSGPGTVYTIRWADGSSVGAVTTTEDGQNLETVTISPVSSAVTINSSIDTSSTVIDPIAYTSTGTLGAEYDSFPLLHTYLSYRQTRHNKNSCNAYYSYPPPQSYSIYDVGEYKTETVPPITFSNGE